MHYGKMMQSTIEKLVSITVFTKNDSYIIPFRQKTPRPLSLKTANCLVSLAYISTSLLSELYIKTHFQRLADINCSTYDLNTY